MGNGILARGQYGRLLMLAERNCLDNGKIERAKHYISTIEDYLFSITNRSETSFIANYTSPAHRICSSNSIQATYLHSAVFAAKRGTIK